MAKDPLTDALAGNYRLVTRLGAGGMGEVWKGVHKTINSKVAIKLLNATAARDRSAQERFLLEAQAVNRIEHSGVVKVIDAGRMDNGRPYLVMELLDGSSLHDLRKAKLLPLGDACRAMIDVLDALHAAHEAGVIHRDLKPANIFRTRDGRVVVVDFGIAKLMAPDSSVRLTITGSAIGTPHYMAPEQIRGKPATPSFDVYAAGVVLFELLCGRRPFDDEAEEGVMHGHLERRPPPPRAIEPAIPVAVQDVILKALAKEPERRFASAALMRDALRDAIAHEAFKRPSDPKIDRSPWARPGTDDPPPETDSALVPTQPAAPAAKQARTPKTEKREDPPSEVLVFRKRSRTRAVLLAASATVAVAGTLLVLYAMRRSLPSEKKPKKSQALVVEHAVDAMAIDAASVSSDAAPTCAQLVSVEPARVPAERRAEVQVTLFKRCEEDHWSGDVIWCYAVAPPKAQADCANGLTAEQRERLHVALTSATTIQHEKPRSKSKQTTAPRPPVAPFEREVGDDLQNPFETVRPKPQKPRPKPKEYDPYSDMR